MEEMYKLLMGVFILILGIFMGNMLAKGTKEELHKGKKWFRLLMMFSLIGAIVFLFIRNDVILFSLLFIAIVTSRSVKR